MSISQLIQYLGKHGYDRLVRQGVLPHLDYQSHVIPDTKIAKSTNLMSSSKYGKITEQMFEMLDLDTRYNDSVNHNLQSYRRYLNSHNWNIIPQFTISDYGFYGIIDFLLYKTPEEIVILDFKTTESDPMNWRNHLQMICYQSLMSISSPCRIFNPLSGIEYIINIEVESPDWLEKILI